MEDASLRMDYADKLDSMEYALAAIKVTSLKETDVLLTLHSKLSKTFYVHNGTGITKFVWLVLEGQ